MTHAVFVPARAKVLESGTVYSKTLQDYVTDSRGETKYEEKFRLI